MGFYFCGRYLYTNGDENEDEWDMYAAIRYFWGSYDVMDMRSEKIILKNYSVISL